MTHKQPPQMPNWLHRIRSRSSHDARFLNDPALERAQDTHQAKAFGAFTFFFSSQRHGYGLRTPKQEKKIGWNGKGAAAVSVISIPKS